MSLYFATKSLFLLLTIAMLTGCASYQVPTEAFMSDPCHPAAVHPLYSVVPRHRCQIRWYDLPHWTTWMLFGNDDDGLFGEEPTARYREGERPSYCKGMRWWVRNPFHNLFFYVIGSAHRQNSELTLVQLSRCHCELLQYRPEAKTVFGGKDSSFFLGLHGGKPFVSLRLVYWKSRQFDCYLGWRERGNFGAKFLPFKRRSKISTQRHEEKKSTKVK